jgi:hypothetical protein
VVVDRFSVDADSTKISLAQWQSQTGQDVHSILITPAELDACFVDPATNDWHLEPAAKAVDAAPATLGNAIAPRDDFELARRPAGVGFDVGCDERPSDCPATWRNYGAGWPGTLGVPTLTPSADPVLGTTVDLQLANSAGIDTLAVFFAGFTSAQLPTSWGGELLVVPDLVVPWSLPAAGLSLPVDVPDDLSLCGVSAFVQALELDDGASEGISISVGLELVLGQ